MSAKNMYKDLSKNCVHDLFTDIHMSDPQEQLQKGGAILKLESLDAIKKRDLDQMQKELASQINEKKQAAQQSIRDLMS